MTYRYRETTTATCAHGIDFSQSCTACGRNQAVRVQPVSGWPHDFASLADGSGIFCRACGLSPATGGGVAFGCPFPKVVS